MCNIYRSVPDAGTHLSLSHVSPARPPRPLDSLTHLPTSLAGFAIWNCHTNHQQSSPCPPSQHGAKDLQRRHQTGGTLTQRGAKGRLSRRNPGGGRGGGGVRAAKVKDNTGYIPERRWTPRKCAARAGTARRGRGNFHVEDARGNDSSSAIAAVTVRVHMYVCIYYVACILYLYIYKTL